MIKNLYNLRKQKTQSSFILDYNGAWEEVWGKGDVKDLNKWNQGKIT